MSAPSTHSSVDHSTHRPPLRRAAVVASVLVWLGTVGPVAAALSTPTFGAKQSTATAQVGMALSGGGLLLIPLTWLAAGIAVIVWLSRARTGAEALSATPHRLSAGWVVGAWFVPLGNLWLPHVVVSDVVRASNPAGERSGPVGWWWGAWITGSALLSAVVPVAAALVALSPGSRAGVHFLGLLLLLAAPMFVVAAACFTRIALMVARWQDERTGALQG